MTTKPHIQPMSSQGSLKRPRKETNSFDSTENKTEIFTTSQPDHTETNQNLRQKKTVQENTYQTEPCQNYKFNSSKVETITKNVLTERLKDEVYDPATCKELSQDLAAQIMEKVKTLKFQRYKLVAVVSIGSLRERPGMQFGSRCLWNQDTDTFASVKFTNGSLFAVAMVYGLYYE